MRSLRVPKHRVRVEVTFADGEARWLEVFLADAAGGHAGPERLSDLLARPAGFVPTCAAGSDDLVCVNLAQVVVVRADPGADAGGPDEANLPTEHELEVCVGGGGRLTGLASYVQPPERSRLTDHLNDGHPFLRLVEGARYAFVNKRYIVRVRPVGG